MTKRKNKANKNKNKSMNIVNKKLWDLKSYNNIVQNLKIHHNKTGVFKQQLNQIQPNDNNNPKKTKRTYVPGRHFCMTVQLSSTSSPRPILPKKKKKMVEYKYTQ